jgi:Na+-driven multidrug efflux pump
MVVRLGQVARERWFWLIVLMVTLIVTVPFIVIFAIAFLAGVVPIWGPASAMVGIIIAWAVASGYKDWVIARRKEEEEKKQREISES